ncbi:spike glycoprotein [Pectobacterium phage PcCB7V]|nr:spike glycoprotein [Pectobacterium phage PcCB7V]
MKDNPNVTWENCDYLLWPAWYAWLSWGLLAAIFIFAGYCTIAEGL